MVKYLLKSYMSPEFFPICKTTNHFLTFLNWIIKAETLLAPADNSLVPIIVLVCYLFSSTGYIGPVSVLIFFVIATVINKLLMSPVVRMVFRKERMEGNFRYIYSLNLRGKFQVHT